MGYYPRKGEKGNLGGREGKEKEGRGKRPQVRREDFGSLLRQERTWGEKTKNHSMIRYPRVKREEKELRQGDTKRSELTR